MGDFLKSIGAYVGSQLSSPTTHLAIATIANHYQDLIPPPWNMLAVVGFSVLGVAVPEKGE